MITSAVAVCVGITWRVLKLVDEAVGLDAVRTFKRFLAGCLAVAALVFPVAFQSGTAEFVRMETARAVEQFTVWFQPLIDQLSDPEK